MMTTRSKRTKKHQVTQILELHEVKGQKWMKTTPSYTNIGELVSHCQIVWT
jgi:hypothetical protein